jgi:hypothetical protein
VTAVQRHEESDQLPEDGPQQQIPEDDASESRGQAEENPGVPAEDEQSTGNPGAAGSDDPEDDSA